MARAAIASGAAPSLAQAASSDPEFGAKSVYNLASRATNPPPNLPYLRPLPRHPARRPHQCFKPRHVRPRRRRLSAWDAYAPTMFNELRTRLLVYAATAPDELANDDERFFWKRNRRLRPYPKPQRPQNHHHPSRLGSDAGLYGAARVAVLP